MRLSPPIALALAVQAAGSAAWGKEPTVTSTPAAPVTVRVEDRVLTPGFLGFGVELDPMALNANNRRRGVTDQDWALLTERLAGMKMPIVRMMTQLGWFAGGPDRFDYQGPQAKSVLAYLDFCQRNDIDVILTDWAWVGECKWLKGHDDPAYATGIAAYLKHLLVERKHTCIKHLIIGNEPDNEIKDVAKYGRMYRNVDQALREAGIRDRVQLLGPDIAGQWEWFDRAIAEIAPVVDGYDFHRYATLEETRDDGQRMLLRNLGRFRPVVDRIDPKGGGKPLLLTEMGLAGGSTNENRRIESYEYGLHMGDYAVAVLRSALKAGIAWCAFDVYYFEGNQFMQWGMWRYKDKAWAPKPWYEAWRLVTSSVPRGSDVLAVSGGSASLHAAALRHGRAFVLLLANRGGRPVTVRVELPVEGRFSVERRTYERAEGESPRLAAERTAAHQPARAAEAALPAESFSVLRLTAADAN